MPLREFIRTVYELAIHRRWDDLSTYLKIVTRLGEQVTVELKAGKPQDIEGDQP